MASKTDITRNCSLVVPQELWKVLYSHHFPGDGDEHGSVLAAGLVKTRRGWRFLVRNVFLACDGIDYVPGLRGYRMLRAEFITEKILYCRDQNLCYLAVHNHQGVDQVTFSPQDLASHERGYPALLQVARGLPIGAVVISQSAVAGDIWFEKNIRFPLKETRIIGTSIQRLNPKPPQRPADCDLTYDRQARIFGDRGQDLLSSLKVGIIGVGGIGSLLVEYLARLGVGHLVVTDPKRIDITNLSRIPGSTGWDAKKWLTNRKRPTWVKKIGERLAKPKVCIMRRIAKRANPKVQLTTLFGNFVNQPTAKHFLDCDFLFLAADSMQARLVFNAMVHQYLIPGIQLGAKVLVNPKNGDIQNAYSVSRLVTPGSGCLWCNGLIPPSKLQKEALTVGENEAQNYVNESAIKSPSVITLNVTAAGIATNDFLFIMTGLRRHGASLEYIRFLPLVGDINFDHPRKDFNCLHCGNLSESLLAKGDSIQLPTRQ